MSHAEQEHGAEYEKEHVHSVYERIAPHFSSTRYKVGIFYRSWPIVEKFLRELPDGSIGLDVGCGNGKYLAVNKNIFIIAFDRGSDASTSAGRALIYVWALEQKDSRRGWDEGHVQDVMVPWVMKDDKKKPNDVEYAAKAPDARTTHYRYYHLYRKGELERNVTEAGGTVLDSGYEKDNWWAIVGRSATDGSNRISPPG
ncbi:MAG: hypothetical protein Q9165_000227 [Trypethelium subeluteriae]